MSEEEPPAADAPSVFDAEPEQPAVKKVLGLEEMQAEQNPVPISQPLIVFACIAAVALLADQAFTPPQ